MVASNPVAYNPTPRAAPYPEPVPRPARALSLLVLAGVLALTGCVADAFPVLVKTERVADDLRTLPGVLEVTTADGEKSAVTPAISDVAVTVDPEADAAQVAVIIQTFARSNASTGTAIVSSTLSLHAGGENQVWVTYPGLSDEEAAALATEWVYLRTTYASAKVTVTGDAADYRVDLAVELGGQPSFQRDATALVLARDVFASLGPVGQYTQVDGRFGATGALPDDAVLALLAAIQGAADITGAQFDGLENSLGMIVEAADPQPVIDLVVASGIPATITFRLPDGTEVEYPAAG